MRGKQWSVDEERLLRQLFEEGESIGQISEVLGKTRVSVKGKLYNLGLSVVVGTDDFHKSVAAATATAIIEDM